MAGKTAPTVIVPFGNQVQDKKLWCWAAVTANTYNALRSAATAALTQCDVVTKMGFSCATNKTGSLTQALSKYGMLDGPSKTPSFATIVFELGEIPIAERFLPCL